MYTLKTGASELHVLYACWSPVHEMSLQEADINAFACLNLNDGVFGNVFNIGGWWGGEISKQQKSCNWHCLYHVSRCLLVLGAFLLALVTWQLQISVAYFHPAHNPSKTPMYCMCLMVVSTCDSTPCIRDVSVNSNAFNTVTARHTHLCYQHHWFR